MKALNLVLGVTTALLLPAPQSAGAQSAFDGAYVLANTSAQDAAISQAIASATSTLSRAARNEWRSRLEELTRPPLRLQIARTGADFAVKDPRGVELKSPADATAVAVAGGWQLDQRVVSGVLEQRIGNGTIAQVYRYSVGADGRTLTVDVRITAPVLSRAITYQLSYRRA